MWVRCYTGYSRHILTVTCVNSRLVSPYAVGQQGGLENELIYVCTLRIALSLYSLSHTHHPASRAQVRTLIEFLKKFASASSGVSREGCLADFAQLMLWSLPCVPKFEIVKVTSTALFFAPSCTLFGWAPPPRANSLRQPRHARATTLTFCCVTGVFSVRKFRSRV